MVLTTDQTSIGEKNQYDLKTQQQELFKLKHKEKKKAEKINRTPITIRGDIKKSNINATVI